MSQEVEPRRLRPGESANRPIGGLVVDTPFAKALRELAIDRGFESQYSLAKALGKNGTASIGRYYLDKGIPSSKEFGNLLIRLQPNDEKMETLIDAYAEELRKGRGNKQGGTSLEHSRARIKPLETPINQWIEGFCTKRNITLGEWRTAIGFRNSSLSRAKLGLRRLSLILQNAPAAFGLSEEETEGLSEAVALEIQQRLEKGKRLQDSPSGRTIKKIQEALVCRTYNGSEAAIELGVTREWVSKLRKKFHSKSPLLIKEELEMFREELEKTRAFREKLQQTRMKNHPKEVTLLQ